MNETTNSDFNRWHDALITAMRINPESISEKIDWDKVITRYTDHIHANEQEINNDE